MMTTSTGCPYCDGEKVFDYTIGQDESGKFVVVNYIQDDVSCPCALTRDEADRLRVQIVEDYEEDDGADHFYDLRGDR